MPVLVMWKSCRNTRLAARASGADGQRLRAILAQSGTEPDGAEIDEVLGILERVGAQAYTRDRARSHRDEALAEISSVGTVDGEAMDRLAQVVNSAISA